MFSTPVAMGTRGVVEVTQIRVPGYYMARSFANHFARRTVYIGSRIPSQHHRRRVFVDRNEIHFNSAEHNVLDEEPLNSAEYAQRSELFRSDRGLGERRE